MKRNPFPLFVLVLAVLIALVGAVDRAEAQVINPTTVEFDVSADHNTLVLGQAAVTRYELRIYAVGATAPVTTFDLGKPTPVGVRATVKNAAIFAPLSSGEYVARVVAVGPGGDGVSAPTVDPFGRLAAPGRPTAVTVGQ